MATQQMDDREQQLAERQKREFQDMVNSFRKDYGNVYTNTPKINSMCSRKKAFSTEHGANTYITKFIRLNGEKYQAEKIAKRSTGLRAYLCTYCFMWHTTMSAKRHDQ